MLLSTGPLLGMGRDASPHTRTHRCEEEGDDDEPDDVVGEGRERLGEAERLRGDRRAHRQERPRACGQRLQHQPCTRVRAHM